MHRALSGQSRRHPRSFNIEDDLWWWLRRHAFDTGQSISELVNTSLKRLRLEQDSDLGASLK